MPLVSILIPSFNHRAFLRACLDSVQAQTYGDWEAVLVDDGSSDDSLAIAEGYAGRDPRIRVYSNDANLGTYGTEQRALGLSKGDLIAVLNSDDVWEPSKLAKQVKALEHCAEARFCFTLGWKVDEHGTVDEGDDVHADWPLEPLQESLPWLLAENRILASSVLLRREGLRFESMCRYSGDWVVLLEQAFHGKAALVPERLTFWRQHGMNTFRRSAKQVLEEIAVRKAILHSANRWFLPRFDEATLRTVQQKLAMNSLNLHALAVLCGEARTAKAMADDARRRDPGSLPVRRRWLLSRFPLGVQRKRLWNGEAINLEVGVDKIEPIPLHLQ